MVETVLTRYYLFVCLFVSATVAGRSSQVGVESELQLLASTTATWDLSLHHGSWQHGARDRTHVLMDTS